MAGPRPRVLVVEDEAAQREILAYNLSAEGYEVIQAATGDQAQSCVEETPPDLVLLDWMIPGVSGIELCRRLKVRPETRAVPVIMLTARAEEGDRVRGLETGADDYVVKPYSVRELMARVRGQLRRARPGLMDARLTHGSIVLDAASHQVTRDDVPVPLGPTEFRLLATLIERPGRVWSREMLLDRVWGQDIDHESRTIDVHIARLRKALTRNGGGDPIRTVRGTGYALA